MDKSAIKQKRPNPALQLTWPSTKRQGGGGRRWEVLYTDPNNAQPAKPPECQPPRQNIESQTGNVNKYGI